MRKKSHELQWLEIMSQRNGLDEKLMNRGSSFEVIEIKRMIRKTLFPDPRHKNNEPQGHGLVHRNRVNEAEKELELHGLWVGGPGWLFEINEN